MVKLMKLTLCTNSNWVQFLEEWRFHPPLHPPMISPLKMAPLFYKMGAQPNCTVPIHPRPGVNVSIHSKDKWALKMFSDKLWHLLEFPETLQMIIMNAIEIREESFHNVICFYKMGVQINCTVPILYAVNVSIHSKDKNSLKLALYSIR